MADNISEKDNFLRFVAFFVDIGTETILKVFYYCQQRNPGIITFPISSSVAKQLQEVLPKHEYYIIKNAQNPEKFDLSILIALVCLLFSHVLPCPVNGWRSRPAQADYSISADLLRLRNIRNEFVAHRNKASLSNKDFEKYWKDVEKYLSRIYTFIKAGNVQDFADRVETYRHTTIEATHAERCFASLNKQHEIIQYGCFLNSEFSRVVKTKQGPYFPYIKLLLEGGRCCLFAYLNTLTRKQNKTLSTVLSDNRTLLLQELGDNHKLVNQIYPDDDPMQINTETGNWDIYVLASVIIIAFGNSIKDKKLKKIKTIRDLRLNYANTAVYAISKDRRFENDCANLLICLTALSESIGGETERECERLIEEYQKTDPAESNADVYFDQLKDPDLGFMSINDVHRGTFFHRQLGVLKPKPQTSPHPPSPLPTLREYK